MASNTGLNGWASSILFFEVDPGPQYRLEAVRMAGLRERLDLLAPPDLVQGTALSLILAGLLSLSFMGFAGLGR